MFLAEAPSKSRNKPPRRWNMNLCEVIQMGYLDVATVMAELLPHTEQRTEKFTSILAAAIDRGELAEAQAACVEIGRKLTPDELKKIFDKQMRDNDVDMARHTAALLPEPIRTAKLLRVYGTLLRRGRTRDAKETVLMFEKSKQTDALRYIAIIQRNRSSIEEALATILLLPETLCNKELSIVFDLAMLNGKSNNARTAAMNLPEPTRSEKLSDVLALQMKQMWFYDARNTAAEFAEPRRTKELKEVFAGQASAHQTIEMRETALLLSEPERTNHLHFVITAALEIPFYEMTRQTAMCLSEPDKTTTLATIVSHALKRGDIDEAVITTELLPETQHAKVFEVILQRCVEKGLYGKVHKIAQKIGRHLTDHELLTIARAKISSGQLSMAAAATAEMSEPSRTEELQKLRNSFVHSGNFREAYEVATFLESKLTIAELATILSAQTAPIRTDRIKAIVAQLTGTDLIDGLSGVIALALRENCFREARELARLLPAKECLEWLYKILELTVVTNLLTEARNTTHLIRELKK